MIKYNLTPSRIHSLTHAFDVQAIKGAKSQGAIKVIGIDKNPMKEAKGQAFGMTDFINPEQSDKPIAELVKDLTGGMGVDYSLECTGVPPLINQAILSTKLVHHYPTLYYFSTMKKDTLTSGIMI